MSFYLIKKSNMNFQSREICKDAFNLLQSLHICETRQKTINVSFKLIFFVSVEVKFGRRITRTIKWVSMSTIGKYRVAFIRNTEAVARRCSVKKVFSGKHLCQSFIFNKVAGFRAAKKRLRHRCFPVNFVRFLRTRFLTDHLWRLLLEILHCCS